MNLYFFYKRERYGGWYNVTLEAWEENDNTYIEGDKKSSFLQLERVRVHLSKDPANYHSSRFDHDLAKDSCMGHHAKTVPEFRAAHEEYEYREISYRQFQRLKKIVVRLYQAYPPINYTERLVRDAPACRILF